MKLLDKIKSRDAVIGIIGMGYVGLPLVFTFARQNFKIIGFDIDKNKIDKLMKCESYIKHIPSEMIKETIEKGLFDATVDFSRLVEADCILICVPTPLDKHWAPDLSYVVDTVEMISKYLKKEQLVILESTTYPGTSDEVIKPILERNGLKSGKDFYLAYSPEREDPGNKNFETSTIPKVVGGDDEESLQVSCALYDTAIVNTVPVSSMRAAEACKILENIYRCVNIAMVNELKVLFTKMDIDVWEVIKAASTKPFGYQPFYPGPGLGGHCIPIDPYYLTWKALEYDCPTRFINLAGEINTSMPDYVITRLMEGLNKHKKALNGSKILILGAAYKKNVDDMRESPSLHLIEKLNEKNANVDYNDPYIPVFPKLRSYRLGHLKSVDLTPENLAMYDAVLIATDHDDYDYDFIVKHSQLVIDSRNATANVKDFREKIIKA